MSRILDQDGNKRVGADPVIPQPIPERRQAEADAEADAVTAGYLAALVLIVASFLCMALIIVGRYGAAAAVWCGAFIVAGMLARREVDNRDT